MAHTCYTYTDSKTGRDIFIIKAKASSIKLTNFYKESGSADTLRNANKYGMNASFFEEKTGNLSSLAYQNGVPVGRNKNDGKSNEAGGCIIAYNNGTLYFSANVDNDSSNKVPKGTKNTWALGGMGLYLGHTAWADMFKVNQEAAKYYKREVASARTALLANIDTKYVYLVACFTLTTTISDMRQALMSYAGIEEGNTTSPWRAILLDGGASAQIRGKDFNKYVSLKHRKVPLIIEVS